MIDRLVIIHRKQEAKGQVRAITLPAGPWLLWRTCLRQMAIGFQEANTETQFNLNSNAKDASGARASRTQIYYGEEAYQFLLEVVCGLHSPILGETEVAGQFKDLIDTSFESKSLDVKPSESCGAEALPAEMTALDAASRNDVVNSADTADLGGLAFQRQQALHRERTQFQKLFSQIIADAKVVRHAHLRAMGSRSYGSLLRRHVEGGQNIYFIGAGHLVREILPWLRAQAREVSIFCRRPVQAQFLMNAYADLKVRKIPSDVLGFDFQGVVIVAAPIEGKVLQSWFSSQKSRITQVIDLRDTASSDALDLPVRVFKLHDLFEELSLVEKETQNKVKEAKSLISELTQKRSRATENRPFGWEDLCG